MLAPEIIPSGVKILTLMVGLISMMNIPQIQVNGKIVIMITYTEAGDQEPKMIDTVILPMERKLQIIKGLPLKIFFVMVQELQENKNILQNYILMHTLLVVKYVKLLKTFL